MSNDDKRLSSTALSSFSSEKFAAKKIPNIFDIERYFRIDKCA